MESSLNVNRITAYFYSLGYFLISILSLSLAFPWAFRKYHNWLIKNSKINGKELVFDGMTKSLYLIYFIGILIGVAIYGAYVGIYTLLLKILLDNNVSIDYLSVNRWSVKIVSMLPSLLIAFLILSRFYKYRAIHTHFKGFDNTKSGIKLQLYKIILSSLIFKVIIILTSFIGYPFAMNIRERFLISRRYVDNNDLKFEGKIGKICAIWYLGLVLSVVTILLYIPYLFFKLNKYIITNTVLKDNECLE